MAKSIPDGICNICGVNGPLSFEHTPPASAFNDCKVLYANVDSYWNDGPGNEKPPRGQQFQRGYGKKSLCERCNQLTGRWYVFSFSRWCRQGMEFYDKTKGLTRYVHFATISPLPVLKQIATIFLARYGNWFTPDKKDSLVRFVLNQQERYLDPKYRFWVYQVAPGPLRDVPPSVSLNIVTGDMMTHAAEFAFPPFGYMMTLSSKPNDSRLCEITHFARYGYLDLVQVALDIAILPNHGHSLGDYRKFRDMPAKKGEPNVVLKYPGHDA